ncbi:MAG: hypothetical protein ABFS03_09965 [Chloroflexota bacterium]
MNWFRKFPQDNFQVMEDKLDGTLRPVVPRQEFKHNLRSRLIAHTFKSVPVPASRSIDRRWLFAGGALGSIFVILTTIRGILSVIGLVGLLLQYLDRQKRSPVSQPAH